MSDLIYGVPAATVNGFDAAYIASKDPQLQALWAKRIAGNVDGGSLIAEAEALARSGDALVLGECDAWGETPYFFMATKKIAGYAWWPNMMQPVPGSPSGFSDPNVRPPGALRVSIDPADFPPFNPPVITPPAAPSLIGNFMAFQINGKDVYSCAAQNHFAEAFPAKDAAGNVYLYHLLGSPAADPLERTGVWLKQ